MLTLTDRAIEKFKEFLNGQKTHGIRIFTTVGGWGPSLAMDVAAGPEKDDATIGKAGVKVFLEKEADALLSDATMDYSDVQGFMITGMPQSSCCS